jgi:16S rRNA processing protein RimM
MATDTRPLLLGQIVGVHGLQGWLKLRSHTDPIEAILDYLPWRLRHRGEERELAGVDSRLQGKALHVHLPGVDDRTAAEAMVGAEIWIDRDALPEAAPGEYYWADLEGLEVVTTDGVVLGRIHHMLATGANDVMAVRGDRERLLPFVQGQYVKSVDLAAGRVVVEWDPEF